MHTTVQSMIYRPSDVSRSRVSRETVPAVEDDHRATVGSASSPQDLVGAHPRPCVVIVLVWLIPASPQREHMRAARVVQIAADVA